MELLGQALVIMVVGMGVVFLFLFIMVQGIEFSARVIRKWEAGAAARGGDACDRGRLVAAIAAAAAAHRSGNTGRKP